MSWENVEVVEAVVAAWNKGDIAGLTELHHPDVILRAPEGWPEPGPFVGRDAVMRQFQRLREPWERDALEAITFHDIGDRVALRLIWRTYGRGPEAPVELTSVYTVRDGRVFYQEYFWDHADALEALGLRE
jgi:ketosteroid isomerase-like protein